MINVTIETPEITLSKNAPDLLGYIPAWHLAKLITSLVVAYDRAIPNNYSLREHLIEELA